jgi:hypothetical protein
LPEVLFDLAKLGRVLGRQTIELSRGFVKGLLGVVAVRRVVAERAAASS